MLFSKDTSNQGKAAEVQAQNYLQQHGLTIIGNNYRCRRGEIDLIMQDKEQLVFVEVKYRKTDRYGSGVAAVNNTKQRRLIYAAKHYLQQYQLTQSHSCRFDIVSISPEGIQWLKNAFYCNE